MTVSVEYMKNDVPIRMSLISDVYRSLALTLHSRLLEKKLVQKIVLF